MRLVIDIGNTRVKAALFKQNELKHFFVFSNMLDLFHSKILESYSIEYAILVTVVNNIDAQISRLRKYFPVMEYSVYTDIPIKNLYASVDTLGGDRLIGAVAANHLYPHTNILMIDAGTCIKYNFVNKNNEFVGGAISPGIRMRFKALNTFTSRLPLLDFDDTYDILIGTTSSENMLSGVELGAVAEINGFIQQYEGLFPDLKVVLTGGDAPFFEKHIKRTIFADPYLILNGLNIVLEYNLRKNAENQI
jgi:type III pantothenate kinase